jgi:phage FluMu protein Com
MDSPRFRCTGCGRVIDGGGLKPDERFKCAKCKKLMRFGPPLFDARTHETWQLGRIVLLMACIAATVWCVTVGYGFGAHTGKWVAGFGGSVLVWLVVVGCIALAARTTQNNGVLVGVTATLDGVSLLFIERLGEQVGYPVETWREFAYYDFWVPGLVACGLVVLAVSLVIQSRARSL